ncbi:MAG: hypothetical protein JWL62_733, partial [Hyphomicrobiales bacterium]|nr:hypothetical protein [Hyphomicrobiales bacterium]
ESHVPSLGHASYLYKLTILWRGFLVMSDRFVK